MAFFFCKRVFCLLCSMMSIYYPRVQLVSGGSRGSAKNLLVSTPAFLRRLRLISSLYPKVYPFPITAPRYLKVECSEGSLTSPFWTFSLTRGVMFAADLADGPTEKPYLSTFRCGTALSILINSIYLLSITLPPPYTLVLAF